MARKVKIGIIGGGNMGAAIIGGIQKLYSVSVCENDKKRVNYLKKRFKVAVGSLEKTIKGADVVVLAVKPQSFDSVLSEAKKYISKDKLVVSIAAGITCSFIEKKLGKGIKVIRTMPNLPAQIGEGITAISKGKLAKKKDLGLAVNIFETIGEVLVVEEKQIDAVTAVSGSGPAYVFLFVECLQKAAKSLGLSKKDSNILVLHTIYGSLDLMLSSGDLPEELRKKVTSKGGTTKAALDVLFKSNITKTYKDALSAAKKRARELSK